MSLNYIKLDTTYANDLNTIKMIAKDSEELSTFLDSEEQEDFDAYREKFEPQIDALYTKVSAENPLQLIAFEEALLDTDFEGLYIGKVLNYKVLRGRVNDNYEYRVTQDALKSVILFASVSPNFDYLKKVLKQGIEVAFGTSSDVWITSVLGSVKNKKVLDYLSSLKSTKMNDLAKRRTNYLSLRKQFSDVNYYSFYVPETAVDFRKSSVDIIQFMDQTYAKSISNDDVNTELAKVIVNEENFSVPNYVSLMLKAVYTIDFSEADYKQIQKSVANFVDLDDTDKFMSVLLDEVVTNAKLVNPTSDARAQKAFAAIKGELGEFYSFTELLYNSELDNPEVLAKVEPILEKENDLSPFVTSLRESVVRKFDVELAKIDSANYKDFFELVRVMEPYMALFSNTAFDNQIKDGCLAKTKEFVRDFTNRRSQEYQDVKNFLANHLGGLGFITDKGVKELIKRKKKVVA